MQRRDEGEQGRPGAVNTSSVNNGLVFNRNARALNDLPGHGPARMVPVMGCQASTSTISRSFGMDPHTPKPGFMG